MSISIKINALKFKGAATKDFPNKSGEAITYLMIPVKKNHFYVSEKGIYIDVTAHEFKGTGKDTHIIKQKLPADITSAMSEEEKKALPIIGNAIDWDKGNAPVAQKAKVTVIDDDDLPF